MSGIQSRLITHYSLLLLGGAALDDLHALVGTAGGTDLVGRLEIAALRAARQGRRRDVVVAAAVAAAVRADLTLRYGTHWSSRAVKRRARDRRSGRSTAAERRTASCSGRA